MDSSLPVVANIAVFSRSAAPECSLFTVVMHAPFHASVLRPASQAGPMHESAVLGKLVNAALLSLVFMRRV